MIRHEQRHVVDVVLVAVSLVIVLGAVGYAQPLVIAPLDGAVLAEREVVFTFERGDSVLVDDNLDFSSALVVQEGERIELEPGVWYWKVEGLADTKVSQLLGTLDAEKSQEIRERLFSGDVRTLTIRGVVALELRSSGEGYEVVNVGNTKLRVGEYQDEILVQERVVDIGSGFEVNDDAKKVLGRQDG
jgi:hypothetical protein